MARMLVIILFISMAIAQRSTTSLKNSGETELMELERQNRITQQIFANYIERRLFPHRRPQQKVPTIDDILPTSTELPRKTLPVTNRKSLGRQRKREQQDDNLDSVPEIVEDGDVLDEFEDRDADSEALQSVESNQHDRYYQDEIRDPAENEVDQGKSAKYFALLNRDCPNCVDETTFTNKWTMPLLKLGEKRYYLGIFFKANWFKAAQYCRFHGMHLASISSQEENDRLEKHIRDFGLGHEHFWISGTDLADEGNFFWMANGRPITFTNWNAGEPNNFRYENGEEENCLELWNRDGKGLKWNDSPCSFETYFVCEVQ